MKTIEFYESKKFRANGAQWWPVFYWRLRAANGEIIANGTEEYLSLRAAKHGANLATWYKVRPDIRKHGDSL